ncbi:hypothetical protein OIU77_018070 [Salix suchowensis]|uniref:Uncharacterized protein n=1 Tax=Salix suchowensis TaxID=1278906 RepID=A0ABQ8ZRL3_9ROSI|nr:hypothetical protein OIU77_018070 [Salix suchowensis]
MIIHQLLRIILNTHPNKSISRVAQKSTEGLRDTSGTVQELKDQAVIASCKLECGDWVIESTAQSWVSTRCQGQLLEDGEQGGCFGGVFVGFQRSMC